MKAAVFYGPRDIRVEDIEVPEIKDHEILVKVKACGICGSDLHMYKLDIFTEKICRPLDRGGVPGHEFSGEVVKTGSQVQGVTAGDRVTAVSLGGMAEYVPVPCFTGYNVLKLPDEVEYEEAATIEPLANSLHATLKGSPARGDNAVVFGAGIIGLGIVQCLEALEKDLGKLIVVDISDHRLALAKALGADEIINASKTDPMKRVQELVGSSPLMIYPDEIYPLVDVVYDCVGYIQEHPEPAVIQQAVDMAREYTGRVVVHGIFEAPVTLDLTSLVVKQVDIFGSFGFDAEEATRALEWLRTGKINRRSLISHEFSLDQARQAFETQCRVEESVKVLIKP